MQKYIYEHLDIPMAKDKAVNVYFNKLILMWLD